MLKVFIISLILVVIALLGMSIKLIFNKKAEFNAGRCSSIPLELKEKGVSCGCGDHCSSEN
jgi:hypothetical protein